MWPTVASIAAVKMRPISVFSQCGRSRRGRLWPAPLWPTVVSIVANSDQPPCVQNASCCCQNAASPFAITPLVKRPRNPMRCDCSRKHTSVGGGGRGISCRTHLPTSLCSRSRSGFNTSTRPTLTTLSWVSRTRRRSLRAGSSSTRTAALTATGDQCSLRSTRYTSTPGLQRCHVASCPPSRPFAVSVTHSPLLPSSSNRSFAFLAHSLLLLCHLLAASPFLFHSLSLSLLTSPPLAHSLFLALAVLLFLARLAHIVHTSTA
jgi:hypothetical protein